MANQPNIIYATLPNVKPRVKINDIYIDLDRYFGVSDEQRTRLGQEAREIGIAKWHERWAITDRSTRETIISVIGVKAWASSIGEEVRGRTVEDFYFSDLMVPQREAMIYWEYVRLYDEFVIKGLFSDNGSNLHKMAGDILKDINRHRASARGR
ncbi:MAG: hypothetical protein Q9221_008681 [Calogaya cf. arnoldii]